MKGGAQANWPSLNPARKGAWLRQIRVFCEGQDMEPVIFSFQRGKGKDGEGR